jgi:hypothetical protein
MVRMRQISTNDLTLSRSLQWFAGQALRRGVGCSVMVLRPSARGARYSLRASGGGARGGDPATLEALARYVRPLLRQSDHLAVEDGAGIGIVLHGADQEGARIVHERIRQVLALPADASGPAAAACVEMVIGLATAEATAAVRVPVVARDLCSLATMPDQALSFPLGQLMPHAVALESARPRRTGQRRRPARRTLATHIPSPAVHAPPHGGDDLDHLRAQADALGVPYVKLPPRLPESLAVLLAADLLREVRAAPIGRTRDTLTVAMDDPTDREAIARLSAATGLTIFPVLVSAGDLARTLR